MLEFNRSVWKQTFSTTTISIEGHQHLHLQFSQTFTIGFHILNSVSPFIHNNSLSQFSQTFTIGFHILNSVFPPIHQNSLSDSHIK